MTQSEGYRARVRWYVEQGVDQETAEAIVNLEGVRLGAAVC